MKRERKKKKRVGDARKEKRNGKLIKREGKREKKERNQGKLENLTQKGVGWSHKEKYLR